MTGITRYLLPFCTLLVLATQMSCTTKNMTRYYYQNRKVLDSMEREFRFAYDRKPFSIEFTDKAFQHVSLEIITDSLKYIYGFELGEKRLNDTLVKYRLPAAVIQNLANQMKSIHCIWINNLDYYLDNQKQDLIFISIRPRLGTPFTNKKYFILTYFAQPQYFDAAGNLLDHRKRKRMRKINEDIFRRINDRVCYTISDRFR